MRRPRRSRNALAVKTGRGHPLRTARSGSPRRRRAPAPPRTAPLPAPLRPAAIGRGRPRREPVNGLPIARVGCRGWRSARCISGSTISSAPELRDRHCSVIPAGPASCRAPVHLRTAEATSAQLRVRIAIPPRGLGPRHSPERTRKKPVRSGDSSLLRRIMPPPWDPAERRSPSAGLPDPKDARSGSGAATGLPLR